MERMIEVAAAIREDGGLPPDAALVFTQLLLNMAGHAGRDRTLELVRAFIDAADTPVRS
jgi:hypothetical protein